MPRPRRTIDPRATAAKLADTGAAFRQRPEGDEPDAFDEALAAAVEGLAEALRADAAALAELQRRARRRAGRAAG